MNSEKQKELEALQKYLGLSSIKEAEKVKWILDELEVYGDWGKKVSNYFTTILSGVEGGKGLIPPKEVEAFKSLFIEPKKNEQ